MSGSPLPSDEDPPVRIGGVDHRAAKEWRRGTHRAMDPGATLARIRPHLPAAGVTRVADITNLDTIGIPVVVAIRPGSRGLAVEAGKGTTLDAAAASACMEAIERFVAEEAEVVDVVGTPRQLAGRLAVPISAFPLMRHATVAYGREYAFTAMTNLLSGDEVLAPEHLVRLASPRTSMVDAPWLTSSNGLASGNHLPESLCAGLYEVIERDAVSLWSSAMSRGHAPCRVDLDRALGDIIGGLVEQVRSSDSEVILLWNRTDLGVPTFTAYIWSRIPGIGTYRGYGCHLDPEIAMIRAITEAAQSRAIFIAAARDDMLRGAFEILKRADDVGVRSIIHRSNVVSTDDIGNLATNSFHGDIHVLLNALDRGGFSAVLARELDASMFEASVCRVLVPGLETYRFAWSPTSDRASTFDPDEF